MPRFDLNGNPMQDDEPAQTGPGPAVGQQPYAAPRPAYQPAPQHPLPPPVLPQAKPASMVDPSKMVLGIVGAVAVIGVAGWLFGALYPAPVPAPASYQPYTLTDMPVTLDQPAGWQVLPIDKSVGSEAVKISGGTTFKNRTAMIQIAEGTPFDPTATSVEAIAQLSNGLSSSPSDMAATRYRRIASRHLAGYKTIDEQFSGTSKAFKYVKRETFTADRPLWGIGGPIKGYFITEADAFQCIAIECECRESDWKTLQPVFDHVIASIDTTGPKLDADPAPATTPQVPSGLSGGM